ncbi:MAG: putative transposase [Paracoccaceae bacterium]|jgi:putative transposase
MRERIREIIFQTCTEMGMHIVKGVLARDHVHMLLSVPPHIALSKVMQRIKGRSSRRIQMEFPEFHKRYWGDGFTSQAFNIPCRSAGPVDIFPLPQEMSLTTSNFSIWNCIQNGILPASVGSRSLGQGAHLEFSIQLCRPQPIPVLWDTVV